MKHLISSLLAALVIAAGAAMAAPTVYIPLGSGNRVIAVDAASDKITATFTGVENPHGLTRAGCNPGWRVPGGREPE